MMMMNLHCKQRIKRIAQSVLTWNKLENCWARPKAKALPCDNSILSLKGAKECLLPNTNWDLVEGIWPLRTIEEWTYLLTNIFATTACSWIQYSTQHNIWDTHVAGCKKICAISFHSIEYRRSRIQNIRDRSCMQTGSWVEDCYVGPLTNSVEIHVSLSFNTVWIHLQNSKCIIFILCFGGRIYFRIRYDDLIPRRKTDKDFKFISESRNSAKQVNFIRFQLKSYISKGYGIYKLVSLEFFCF